MIFSYLLLLLPLVSGHSWLECSDYATDVLGEYDRSLCRGYPRAFERQFNEGFGHDTGYELRSTNCAKYPLSSADYSHKIPMATYAPGQIIHLSHPAKNHVADTCTNPFIPSRTFTVTMSSVVGVDTYDVPLALVGGDHVNGQIDYLGFQRCYKFCEDMDKSHCISSWALPKNVSSGQYSFLQLWEFNPGEFYANCFDAYIIGSAVDEQSFSGNETSESGSNGGDDITEPAPTPAQTVPSPEPTRTPVADTSSSDATDTSPSPETSLRSSSSASFDGPEIITSDASSNAGPIALFQKYVMSMVGSFNITAVLNVTTTNIQL